MFAYCRSRKIPKNLHTTSAWLQCKTFTLTGYPYNSIGSYRFGALILDSMTAMSTIGMLFCCFAIWVVEGTVCIGMFLDNELQKHWVLPVDAEFDLRAPCIVWFLMVLGYCGTLVLWSFGPVVFTWKYIHMCSRDSRSYCGVKPSFFFEDL